jgi:NTP pyrophosphatase (non-canonical NTP hydrolase)
MNLSDYQREASRTCRVDVVNRREDIPEGPGILIPLLGMAGEVGSLLAEYKKWMRDGPAHGLFREQIQEDLGDLLWYVADVASKFGLDLDQIADSNLEKTRERWPCEVNAQASLYDDGRSPDEQFPRQFTIRIEQSLDGGKATVACWWGTMKLGNDLTDNAHDEDGYRFHDVFHFAFAAILGWSPILRNHMGRKRRTDRKLDEVEDGGRAKVIEEAISALVFDYASKHNYLEGVNTLDYQLLKSIKTLVADREVRSRSMHEWEKAILIGYEVWREVRANQGGRIEGDLELKTLVFHDS